MGPAVESPEKAAELIAAGMNVARLNLSHGGYEEHQNRLDLVRKAAADAGKPVAILVDLQGPKIRLGRFADGPHDLNRGDRFIITTDEISGTKERVGTTYKGLPGDCKKGDRILIDDGKVTVEVVEVKGNDVITTVIEPGAVSNNKGINLPGVAVSVPAMSEKDREDLRWGLNAGADFIALSFVRSAKDIEDVHQIMDQVGKRLPVIAKIEKPQAVENLEEIVAAFDGIMVARGDLGVELPVERIPLIQKELIRKCIHRAKPVIVATQMMESMIDRVKPNRSEITDVANAVLEGADAVMLSGETATGQHPALVVKTMRKIIAEVESKEYRYNRGEDLRPQPHSPSFHSDAICYSACRIANDVGANALIGMTQSGYTAFMLSSYRPFSPLYIFTKEKSLVNQLSLSWGVRAFYYAEEISLDEIITDQIDILKERGFITAGQVVVNTGSTPVDQHLPTNVIKISTVS